MYPSPKWLPKWSRSELIYGGLSLKIEHGKLVAILTLKKSIKCIDMK